MKRFTWAEVVTIVLSILSLSLWLADIKTPDGSQIFVLTILGAILLMLSVTIIVNHGLLSVPFWRWVLPLVAIASALFIYTYRGSIGYLSGYVNWYMILTNCLYVSLFFVFVDDSRAGLCREMLTYLREHWIYLAFAPISVIWLKVVILFTPNTIDEILKNIDISIFRGNPDAWVRSALVSEFSVFWFSLFYFLLPYYPILLSGYFHIKKEPIMLRKVTQSFLLCGMIGWVFYVVFPAIGPAFVDIKLAGFPHPSIPRNCFPSLHTAWGLLVLIYAFKYRRVAFWIMLMPVSQMILATIVLRYHYVIDIFAALPFTLFIYWLNEKLMVKELSWKSALTEASERIAKSEIVVYTVFVLSGLSALIYQVYFMKKVSLIFGSSALAVTTVLAAYMFGLAVGSYGGGRIADRVKSPIRIYAFAEAIVGVLLLISPTLFNWMESLYVSIGRSGKLSLLTLTFIRVFLSLPVILLPTVAMGTTLPLLTKYLSTGMKKVTANISRLYSANIMGAALGTFLATYVLMPEFGMFTTIIIAVLINLVIALVVLRLGKRFPSLSPSVNETIAIRSVDSSWHLFSPQLMNVILIISALVLGFVSFAEEVLWTHLLAMIVGNSVYAFGVMLIAVLFGLALGGYVAGRLPLDQRRKLLAVSILQFIIAGLLLLQLILWDKIPVYMQDLWITATSFPEREFVRFAISFALLVLPTMAVGLTFPFLASLYSNNLMTLGTRIGRISFFNTSGNILGTMIMGFILLPMVGSFNASILITILTIANGFMLFYSWPGRRKIVIGGSIVVIFSAALIYLPRWNLTNLSLGTNVYFQRQHNGTVIDSWEEKDGGFTTITEEDIPGDAKKKVTLWTNGKFQGDNQPEMEAQFRFALYPILFCKKTDRALVIGLGTGVSGRVVQESAFRDVEVAEISPGIVTAAKKYFSEENGHLLDQKNVRLRIEDGRNLLLLNQKPYDLITMEVSSVWFAGAASLYSVEFYELAKRNLAREGVFQQWIQLHHISPHDVLVTIATVRHVFPHVRLFYGGSQGVILASQEPLLIPFQELVKHNSNLQSLFIKNISPYQNVFCLLGEQLLGEQGINNYLAANTRIIGSELKHLTSDDNNMFLEYSTPKGNVNNYVKTLQENIRSLRQFNENGNDVVTDIPSLGWQYYVSGCYHLGQKQYEIAKAQLLLAKALFPPEEQEKLSLLIESIKKTNQQ